MDTERMIETKTKSERSLQLQRLVQVGLLTHLDEKEVRVLFSLWAHADYRTGSCFPTIRRLENQSGLKDSSVRRAIKSLSGKGVISVERRHGQGPNRYFLHDDPGRIPLLANGCKPRIVQVDGPDETPLFDVREESPRLEIIFSESEENSQDTDSQKLDSCCNLKAVSQGNALTVQSVLPGERIDRSMRSNSELRPVSQENAKHIEHIQEQSSSSASMYLSSSGAKGGKDVDSAAAFLQAVNFSETDSMRLARMAGSIERVREVIDWAKLGRDAGEVQNMQGWIRRAIEGRFDKPRWMAKRDREHEETHRKVRQDEEHGARMQEMRSWDSAKHGERQGILKALGRMKSVERSKIIAEAHRRCCASMPRMATKTPTDDPATWYGLLEGQIHMVLKENGVLPVVPAPQSPQESQGAILRAPLGNRVDLVHPSGENRTVAAEIA